MRHLPNAITLGNLGLGCFGIVVLFQVAPIALALQQASYCIFVCLLLDFLDGLTARLLRAQSALGRELDSLADMVSFGVLPGLMWYRVLELGTALPFLSYTAFLIPIAAAIRLARFNLESEGGGDFKGLPSPANALAVAGLTFAPSELAILWTYEPYTFLTIIFLLGGLMVSSLPLLSLKFKGGAWQENWARYLLILGAILGLAYFQLAAVSMIFVFYLVISLIYFSFAK